MDIVEENENKNNLVISSTASPVNTSSTTASATSVTVPGTGSSTGGGGNEIISNTVVTTTTTITTPASSSSTTEATSASNPVVEYENGETGQIIELRDPLTRPAYRLSVKLIDTYKHINKVYYEAKARKIREQGNTRAGVYNDGYDDQNYDYIIHGDEMFAERYILKHRIGKGSFGQVVCAYDRQTQTDVAIKIIKSKHAFMVQAKTEIKLLELAGFKDRADDQNIVRLLDTFVYRKHQCLVFEMLSYNLYELLKNTKFRGVSLSLVRKFAKQILKGLEFLSREDVDIIHCDLKPENILLRHPKRSAIKIIDFGSSCLSTKKTYTYIQSRFYRSPEVLLGLPYSQKIDIWSLGCVLVEMHTGEPLFGGVDQLDQLNRIVNVLGMLPAEMIAASPLETRNIFFERVDPVPSVSPVPPASSPNTTEPPHSLSTSTVEPSVVAPVPVAIPAHINPDRLVTIVDPATGQPLRLALKMHKSEIDGTARKKDSFRKRTLEEIIGVETGGPQGRRLNDSGHTPQMYSMFTDFIRSMLIYQPSQRTNPIESLKHPYLQSVDSQPDTEDKDKQEDSKSAETAKPAEGTGVGVDPSSQAAGAATTVEAGETKKGEEDFETKTLPTNNVMSAAAAASADRRRSLSAPRLTSTGTSAATQSAPSSDLKATVGIESQVQQISVSASDPRDDQETSGPATSSTSTSSMNNPCA